MQISNTRVKLSPVARPLRSVIADDGEPSYTNRLIYPPLPFSVAYPSKLEIPAKHADAAAFVVQQHSRVRVLFNLMDGDVPMTPHQVFMQLTHKTTLQSITYVCQKSATNEGQYTFTLVSAVVVCSPSPTQASKARGAQLCL